MNHRLLFKYTAFIAAAVGLLMLPSAAWAIWYGEWRALAALLTSTAVSLALAGGLYAFGRTAGPRFYQREALALVGMVWFWAAALGALPFVLSGLFSPVDAFFESMSGFTTTGASVLTDYAHAPRSIMFWRAFTHWLGGMGIVVLFIAVLPYLGAGGKLLFRSETPGPDPRGLSPRIKTTASLLYKIYLGLTIVETTALMLAGMSLHDALCHTFSTLGTGGFSNRALSVGAYNSLAIEVIIIVFMIIAGTNFALIFALLRGRWHVLWRDSEWRLYLTILVVSTLVISMNLMGIGGFFPWGEAAQPETYDSGGRALRDAAFQVASIMTTTGFANADFDDWPSFSRMLLVALMFVGGCAGSTGGGIKVVRIIILLKMAFRRIESTYSPKTVRALRVSGQVVEDDVQSMVYGFFVLYVLWFVAGTLVMSAYGLPFTTAATSIAATLNNVGPGLEAVGPTLDYHLLPSSAKLFLSLCMVLGRLELFSVMVFLMPGFWRAR